MQTLSVEEPPAIANQPLTTGVLRQWCSPEVILVVTDLEDEESLQFHVIEHARRSGAKVLLVCAHGMKAAAANGHKPRRTGSINSMDAAHKVVHRMTRRFLWSGIACEPILVRGLRADEIPSIARSCCADRVLVSAPIDAEGAEVDSEPIAERIIDGLGIPICVVGRSLPLVPRYQRPTRRITLVLSLEANNEIPIAFASRFAQENYSHLSLMHVYPEREGNVRGIDQTKASFVSRLPRAILREAELFCPVEIVVREGEAGSQILNHDSSFNQDYLILAPDRTASPDGFGMSAVRKVIRHARCPVFVLNQLPPVINRSSSEKASVAPGVAVSSDSVAEKNSLLEQANVNTRF